jgi:hypothetical protein
MVFNPAPDPVRVPLVRDIDSADPDGAVCRQVYGAIPECMFDGIDVRHAFTEKKHPLVKPEGLTCAEQVGKNDFDCLLGIPASHGMHLT